MEIPSPRPTTTTHGSVVANNIPITTRSDPNSPYPTTFVTADSSSFKHVVQLLTGSSDKKQPQPPPPTGSRFDIPPVKTPHMKQQQGGGGGGGGGGGFKLYERRNSAAFKNMIINAHRQNAAFPSSPRPNEILSPSLLDFPGLTLSPVTPLTEDPFGKSSPSISNGSQPSDEGGFYFQPSPISTPRDSEPKLLPLFPLSSPTARP